MYEAGKTDIGGMAALILSGGYSSRMGAFKPLLPFGGGTVLDAAISTFAAVGHVVVVCGHNAPLIRQHLSNTAATVVENTAYSSGMFSSVLAGVDQIQSMRPSAFFIMPVDYPLVSQKTPALLARHMIMGKDTVVYPVYKGVRGHPPLISSRLIPRILAHDGHGGLAATLQRHAYPVDVNVDDIGTALDMDTPQDYHELQKLWEQTHTRRFNGMNSPYEQD